MRDGAATARRQMCIQWTLLVGKMSASRRRAIGYRFGKGFRLPFAVQSKGSLKTNECGIIMNAGENIGSLKWLPRVLTACWQAVRWQKLRFNARLVFWRRAVAAPFMRQPENYHYPFLR